MLIHILQSSKWYLHIASLLQPTVRNSKTLHLLPGMTKEILIFKKLGQTIISWNMTDFWLFFFFNQPID